VSYEERTFLAISAPSAISTSSSSTFFNTASSPELGWAAGA
jgi:hypothetical protein